MVLYIKKLFLNLSLDEKANVITHGIGLLLAILAAPWLIITAFQPQLILGLGIFMFGMMRLSSKTPSKNQDKQDTDVQ